MISISEVHVLKWKCFCICGLALFVTLSLLCHYTLLLLLSSGRACMPSHMEGWFYTLPGRKTLSQDGHIRWGPVPVFCVWPAPPTQPSPSLPSGTVWWCNLQWAALSSGGFSHNETYSKWVSCLIPGSVATFKWKRLKQVGIG